MGHCSRAFQPLELNLMVKGGTKIGNNNAAASVILHNEGKHLPT